jgi:hypothetical protein
MKMPEPTSQEAVEANYLYGGASGITLSNDRFDLNEGVELRQVYAHLFSANMMAFRRPQPKGPPSSAMESRERWVWV